MKHVLQVDVADAGTRVDRFVGVKLAISRSKLKALFDDQAVRVNGRKVKKGDELAAGQTVEVEHDDSPTDAVADTGFDLKVLYEDESVVFVDKPAGVASQPLEAKELGTIANALIARFPEMAAVGDDKREAGLCHRLDVETSGVLLAARTRPAWEAMRKAFSGDREVEKKYVALVTGPIADEGTIEVPLEHSGDHVKPVLEGHGRAAHTDFKVVARKGVYSLVEVKLITGVLHQVRAHLAAIGAPIVGDTLYGGRPEEGLARFFLHAASLAITHPVTRKWLVVESPLPPELSEVLARRVPR